MRFLVCHNRHHKVSRSSYVTKLLLFCEELGLGGHFVMPIQCPRNLIMRVYWTTLVFRHWTYWRQILRVGCQWEPSTSEIELATFHIFKGKPLKKGIWQKRLCLWVLGNNPKIKIKDKMQRKEISEAVGWTQILKAMRLQWCYQIICKSKNKVKCLKHKVWWL